MIMRIYILVCYCSIQKIEILSNDFLEFYHKLLSFKLIVLQISGMMR